MLFMFLLKEIKFELSMTKKNMRQKTHNVYVSVALKMLSNVKNNLLTQTSICLQVHSEYFQYLTN